MEVKQITKNTEWEEFVLSQPETLFVQSSHYGQFYESQGEKFWIFGVYDNGKLVGGSLVVSTHAKRGNFLYLPYGPIFSYWHDSFFSELFCFLKKFAKENGYDFIRSSPFLEDTKENKSLFKLTGFRPAPMHILAETTWILDLTVTEDELLRNMKKNHRNLIRRCIRDGVKIEKSTDVSALSDFNKLHDKTAKRHNFHRFSNEYVTREFKAFSPYNQSEVLYAYLPDGQLDAGAIVMYYNKTAAYRHGASLNLDRQLPGSYLLQWEAIKEAKKRGMRWYNFWGIAPEKASNNHPFQGITHFKKGFGGQQKNLLHCQDLPVSWSYWLNWVIETLRRLHRGFK